MRKLRHARELTQETLAAKCNGLGWDLGRGTLAKIEAAVRCVTDAERFVLAKALKQELGDLHPQDERAVLALFGE